MLTWIIIGVTLVVWILVYVIPFRHQIYNWYDQRWGR